MKNAPPAIVPTHPAVAALDRLGDEIAELSAHLDGCSRTAHTFPRERPSGWPVMRAGW